tara:strand:+ start:133 stop:510 length:378 start_codon:yes stop_codon:yes gene_type:complete
MIKGPKDIPPKLSGPSLKTSHDGEKRIASAISSGLLIVNSLDISLVGKTIENNPTIKENNNKKLKERHHIRGGNKLQNVIKKRTSAIEILQMELARIGLNKKRRIQENLIRGSITRSQLDFPAIY